MNMMKNGLNNLRLFQDCKIQGIPVKFCDLRFCEMKKADEKPRKLVESDYLLGVYDKRSSIH